MRQHVFGNRMIERGLFQQSMVVIFTGIAAAYATESS